MAERRRWRRCSAESPGETEAALRLARSALSRSPDERLVRATADAYQALGVMLEHAADHGGADYDGAGTAVAPAIEFSAAVDVAGVA